MLCVGVIDDFIDMRQLESYCAVGPYAWRYGKRNEKRDPYVRYPTNLRDYRKGGRVKPCSWIMHMTHG